MSAPKTIRVIAPSQSWQQRKVPIYRRAVRRLEMAGYAIDFGSNIKERDWFGTASIQSRAMDLHDALEDDCVKAILCLDGGWSANQLLPSIDWKLVGANPKPIIGYSDCTVLLNAIYAKTGQKTLLGPVLTTLGDKNNGDMSLVALISALEDTCYEIMRTPTWKSGNNVFRSEKQWGVLNPGSAEGVLIGGNLGSLYLLQGTPYMPAFERDTILAIEDDDEALENTAKEFDRRLESILQQPNARRYIVGVVVGRFQKSSAVSRRELELILGSRLGTSIPIVYDVGFGHTSPMATLRIGGVMRIELEDNGKARLYER